MLNRIKKKSIAICSNLILLFFLLIVLYPVYFIMITSFESSDTLVIEFSVQNFSLDNWKYILGIDYINTVTQEVVRSPYPFIIWFKNSIKIASITAAIVLFICTLAAYGLYRFTFFGKKYFLISLIILQMFPSMMGMVALFLLLSKLGTFFPWFGLDTHAGLILTYLGMTPFFIWLTKSYFSTIPKSIVEAAMIDGCKEFTIFYSIILPLALPMLVVIFILVFITVFSDFVIPSILIKDPKLLTFAVGMREFISAYDIRWGKFAAATILGGLPIVIIFMITQKFLVQGLTKGSVKE